MSLREFGVKAWLWENWRHCWKHSAFLLATCGSRKRQQAKDWMTCDFLCIVCFSCDFQCEIPSAFYLCTTFVIVELWFSTMRDTNAISTTACPSATFSMPSQYRRLKNGPTWLHPTPEAPTWPLLIVFKFCAVQYLVTISRTPEAPTWPVTYSYPHQILICPISDINDYHIFGNLASSNSRRSHLTSPYRLQVKYLITWPLTYSHPH